MSIANLGTSFRLHTPCTSLYGPWQVQRMCVSNLVINFTVRQSFQLHLHGQPGRRGPARLRGKVGY